MKLHQEEYCHNCQKYVIYEFDDITEKQIIICPNCGHQHYRELDEGTIINIRINKNQNKLYYAEAIEPNRNICSDVVSEASLSIKTFNICGYTPDGRPIVEKTNDLPDKSEQTKIMTERRWGRDPRQ
jgi:DNA-directed RNA polymerase subunit M/transcription elongation factor TFIIS